MANNSGTAVPTRNVVQEDALAIAVQHKRCGLAISMGVGKTRIAIQHLQRYYDQFIQVLVVVPKHSVAQSWIDELGKMGLEALVKHITFTTYISLKKREPNNYDIVYLDECHSLKYVHELFLARFTGRILGLTGTPPKNTTSEKGMLVQKYCPIKYTFTTDDATDSKEEKQGRWILVYIRKKRL
jgi:superfamily II DNA or RNA helicase